MVIDFAGGALTQLPGSAPVDAIISVDHGAKVLKQKIEWDGARHFWRVIADILPVSGQPANVRCYLALKGQAMTDTWTYLLHAAKE